MADITKCGGHNCPWKRRCYRYTAMESKVWQSFFMEIPGYYKKAETPDDETIWVCEMYWPVKEKQNE